MKKIWVVIVTFNAGEKVVECLKSLFHCKTGGLDHELKIVVVDNHSTDKSVEFIKKLTSSRVNRLKNKKINSLITSKSTIKLIENKTNLGFAAASNIGIKKALKSKADYILLLNPDTTVKKNFLTPLLEVLKRPKAGICGPKILFESASNSKKPKIWSAGGKLDKIRFSGGLIGHNEEDRGQYNAKKSVDFISGTCMLIKKQVFEKIGFLAEDYFLYYEDVDFCFQAGKVGYRVIYNPLSIIYHFGSFTINKNSKIMQYYLARNRLLFLSRYASLKIKIREIIRLSKTIDEHLKNQQTWAIYGILDFFLRKRGMKNELHGKK